MRDDNRIKVALRLDKTKLKEMDQVIEQENIGSRNAFIDNAIEFYIGYLLGSKNKYFPSVISNVIDGALKITEDRISRLLFKNTVELAMALNVIAYNFDIDDDTLKKLRQQCVNEVKGTIGRINFEEIRKFQRNGEQ
ncbi:MAG: hypothetical protein RR700_06460 [Anaerorhabdus sp.]|uniref:hypothetical protein n=1 Tax=Anaerorhabdus sp. TaxID=1872524 RepID=UPI002FCC4C08